MKIKKYILYTGLPLTLFFSFVLSCSEFTRPYKPVYSLSVQSENGTVTIEPDQPKGYAQGSIVILTTVPYTGYDFSQWTGNEESMLNPLIITMDSDKAITSISEPYESRDYYINYDTGNDQNDGLSSSTPWKHAPGDSEAMYNAAATALQPGNRLIFRGGVVYRGQIAAIDNGTENYHIKYIGNDWPADERAIIDGGDLISGWSQCTSAAECNDNPNYASVYFTYLPGNIDPLSINLHEYNTSTGEDEFLWPAQDPDPGDPYFYDDCSDFITIAQTYLTRTSLTSSSYFTQSEADYWNDSYVLVWINPNIVATRRITSYDPASHRIYFDDLGENAIYPDGRDHSYAIFNSIHALDSEGEYYITTTADTENRLKLYLWPRNTAGLDTRITYSVRNWGFNLGSYSNITIEGFEVRKHSGTGLRDGIGIGTYSASHLPNYNLIIKDNYITHNRKGGSSTGYGGIFLSNIHNSIVEDNLVESNPRQAGIFFGSSTKIFARNNTIIRSGATSLRLYSVEQAEITGNIITGSYGSHANGLTIYIASKNILVAGNHIYDNASPVTIQDSGNLYFINNIIDAFGEESNVNEWGETSRGPWEYGDIAFFNNTIVRNDNNDVDNDRNASLNIGSVSQNRYIVINNILDGGASGSNIIRSHNIYTGLAWSQTSAYDWALNEGEIVEEDLDLIFADVDAYPINTNPDFQLFSGSIADNAGRDITPYFPLEQFPDFNYYLDFEGNTRDQWDIGAYSY